MSKHQLPEITEEDKAAFERGELKVVTAQAGGLIDVDSDGTPEALVTAEVQVAGVCGNEFLPGGGRGGQPV